MNRRQVLQVIGGGAIAAACMPSRDPAQAWVNPGATETDPRRSALAWGILAPNPHNMQPWRVDLRTPGEATLFVAQDRLLPQTDPLNRQIVIGCGAFCELTRLAAAREGWRVDLEPFPKGGPAPVLDARPVARLRFERATPVSDPLLSAALDRRTNRAAYEPRAVEFRSAQSICDAARREGVMAEFTVDSARTAKLRAVAYEGARVEAYTPAAHKESIERTFFGQADIAAHPYGVSIRGPMPEFAHAVGLLDRKAMETHGSFGFNQAISFLKTGADTARGFVWLTTPDNTRVAQFEAVAPICAQTCRRRGSASPCNRGVSAFRNTPPWRPRFAPCMPNSRQEEGGCRCLHGSATPRPARRRRPSAASTPLSCASNAAAHE